MVRIDLNTPDIMDAKEASKIWGHAENYVRRTYQQNPDKFPDGSIRKFGKQWIVTTEGMEKATGVKDPSNMEQQRTADTRTSGFADGLWQASANVSVGVQLNITPQVGLYFEPGVSYFVPDGSSLPNVRHEHPWNFNMQGGLRLSVGK